MIMQIWTLILTEFTIDSVVLTIIDNVVLTLIIAFLDHIMRLLTRGYDSVRGGGGGANTKVPDMYGGGGVFSGPKTQK